MAKQQYIKDSQTLNIVKFLNSDCPYLAVEEFDAIRYGFELNGFNPEYIKSLERALTNKDISPMELYHYKHDIRTKLLRCDNNKEITAFIQNRVKAEHMDFYLNKMVSDYKTIESS